MTLSRPWPPYPEFVRELRRHVWSRDPVGLAAHSPPEDEYDSVVSPLSGWLRGGLDADALETRLGRLLMDEFSMRAPGDTRRFAERIIAWYDALPAVGD
jgi:hypothetical protein